MLWALLLQAVFGVADPVQPFSPVAAPTATVDPCRDRGASGTWIKMSAAGAPASIHNLAWTDSASVWNGTRLVVATRQNVAWSGAAFDPCANAWSPLSDLRNAPRSEPWRAESDRPFRPGHVKSALDSYDRAWIWDFKRKTWVSVSSPHAPEPRAHYAVVATDQRLLFWGGFSAARGSLGDGAILSLATGRWKPMSQLGALSPRFAPVVAWTGKRLLIWGGRWAEKGEVRDLADGAQYDPARDRWQPMSAADAPTPDREAITAWTGRKLVVVSASGAGGIYHPESDRWTRLGEAPGKVQLPKRNIGPLTRILVAADGRVLFLPERLTGVLVLDADRAQWSTIAADELGPRNGYRAFLLGRRLIVWGGQVLIAEHRCPPPQPGQPICDSFSESAPRNDGYMLLLPK